MLLTVDQQDPTRAFQVVRMELIVNEDDWRDDFDSIQVWRSRETEAGPYEEVTGPAWMPARLPAAAGQRPASPRTGPIVNIVGKTLELLLNERDEVLVEFTGSDPLTFAQAALQVTAQSAGRLSAYVDANDRFVVETLQPGTGITLRAKPGDAATFLALPTEGYDALVFGRSAFIQLQLGKTAYDFRDESGSRKFFYKTRFLNRSNNTASEYSTAYNVERAVTQVAPSAIAVGYMDLLTNDGKASVGVEVSVYAPFVGTMQDSSLVAGGTVSKRTDRDGHVEFELLRGATYTVAIAGTNLVKEIVVPSDPAIQIFGLLDPTYGTQEDYFKARIPDIPTMERRSL